MAETRCEEGGQEILPIIIRVARAERLDLRFIMCKSNALLRAYVDGNLVAERASADELEVAVPTLDPGLHLLYWSFQNAGAEWQTLTEVVSSGTVRFRHRKTSDGNDPVNRGFLYVEVSA